jgi:MFS family permease
MPPGDEQQQQQQPAELTPLDGGRVAWLVVLASFVAHIQCLGTMYTFTLFVLPFQATFGLSAAAAALPGSVATGAMLASGPIVGKIVDRYGSRSSSFVLALMNVCGMYWVSVAQSHASLVLAHLLTGLGMAMAPTSVGTVQQHFDKKRAFATGVALAGSGGGQFILAQLISARMRAEGDSPDAWRSAAQALTVTGAVLLVPSSLLLRARKVPDSGTPDGKPSAPGVPAPTAVAHSVSSLVHSRSVGCVLACVFTGSFGMYVPFAFLAPFLESIGVADAYVHKPSAFACDT